MLAVCRAAFAALALLVSIFSASAFAAEKAFQREELNDSAIRLEAQIKTDAGQVQKPAAQLRTEADAAFRRADYRGGMVLLGQLVAAGPEDASSWVRLARTISQIRANDTRERNLLLERAASAAYAGYKRSKDKAEEAEALQIIGKSFADRKVWRPALDATRLSLELREAPELRLAYETMRADYGFRMLDYSVDADAASPRACFQFSEELAGRRADFAPFVSVEGMDKPAVSADERQLCVEGLKHGERYSITLRNGLPSVVKETLAKPSTIAVYVRDRKPFVRFGAKAYVLPRNGQRGIPVVSVNTKAVILQVLRVGDRNLMETVLGRDFQRNLRPSEVTEYADEKGARIWQGEMAVESNLNAEITTAFPVETLGELTPGVYAMVASAKDSRLADEYDPLATQWFVVSDLGLTALSGNDGVRAYAHSLASAEAKGLIEIRLMARNNEVIATKRTDSTGGVHFDAALTRGEGALAPAMIVASDPRGDYAFLSLKNPAFDFSDRGVAGRALPAGLDAYVYTERGVYRPGETVHATALLRDAKGIAAPNAPLTLVMSRPDGVEYRRAVVEDQGIGGRAYSVPLGASVTTGTWKLRAYTDPKRPAIGEVSFLVEDYVPDRIEFDLKSDAARITRGQPVQVTVAGRYLYGALASEMTLEGEVLVAPAKERAGFAGYQFGIADEEVSSDRIPLQDLPQTDAAGKASVNVALDKLPSTTRPLDATVVLRMAESGGRAVERRLSLPVTPQTALIGVKPLFAGKSLGEGEAATFDVVFVQPDGKAAARENLRYELLKVETRYQYYRRDGSWNYEPVKQTKRVGDGAINVTADNPGRLTLPVEFGRYRLEVTAGDGTPQTAITFDAGFYAEASADTPDLLELALDKKEYAAGDSINVALTARTAGKVTLQVIADRLVSTTTQDVQPGVAKLRVPVGKDWGSGAYIVATLRRPLDEKAQRMPGRAIGVQWFAIDHKARTLEVSLGTPELQRPNTPLKIPVQLTGLASGEEARVVIAAVDVGILNLTKYQSPAPDEYYLGQRRLTAEWRDLYGQLIDGMQGARGAVRAGGDGGGAELQAAPPKEAPLAFYSGLVKVGSDGKAEVTFDLPAFSGSVRVMASAWSRDKLGKAQRDVTVRDALVATATLPRFLLKGDVTTFNLEIDNVEGASGDYRIDTTVDGPLKLNGAPAQLLTLKEKQRGRMGLAIEALNAGRGSVAIKVSGPNGFTLARSYGLDIKPATQVLTRRLVRPIGKGESLTLSSDMFADFVPGTGSVALSVGASTALDAATILRALDRYPFGCSEQITSRAVALLYANELAAEALLALDTGLQPRIQDGIDRLLARQGSNGSFGLWSAGGDDAWLDAYVTDFLTRAREQKFTVPDTAFKLALERLRNTVANAVDVGKDGGRDQAYALYVLARNGVAPLGDLRYIADTKLSELVTPIARAQIAAALGMLGDKARAERAYESALGHLAPQPVLQVGREDYGSALRDAAALVTLASEGNAPRPTITGAVARVEAARNLSSYTSTQENAWLVLAARAINKDAANVALAVDGQRSNGALYRSVRASELGTKPITVANAGEGPVQAVVSVSGNPLVPEPAIERGFKIERNYFTLDGKPADATKAKQNDRFAVVLKITEGQPQFGRIMVADYLPAGFEIDNPRIVSSGETSALEWIEDGEEPAHSEFRDDRFNAAFDREAKDSPVFTVAYVVRAVSPGKYVAPQAIVEDMYRADRFGRTGTGSIEVTAAR